MKLKRTDQKIDVRLPVKFNVHETYLNKSKIEQKEEKEMGPKSDRHLPKRYKDFEMEFYACNLDVFGGKEIQELDRCPQGKKYLIARRVRMNTYLPTVLKKIPYLKDRTKSSLVHLISLW